MRRDSRLSGVLHVLLHMVEFDRPVTSERLATVLGTHPVVVRRLMGTLREAGLVASEKGHGGGWRIACDPARVTLRDIHVALGSPDLLALGNRTEAPACLVEQAVNAALADAFREAEEVLLSRLGDVTLARLGADVHARMTERGRCGQKVLLDADA